MQKEWQKKCQVIPLKITLTNKYKLSKWKATRKGAHYIKKGTREDHELPAIKHRLLVDNAYCKTELFRSETALLRYFPLF